MTERLESGSSTRRKNQTWWTEEIEETVGKTREIWKMVEVIKENWEQPNTTLQRTEEEGGQEQILKWRRNYAES